MQKAAKRWFISGTVQGVGFRYFAQNKAGSLGVTGWARNLDDGRVEVYGIGTPERLSDFASALHVGPRGASVRGIEEQPATVEPCNNFRIR